MKILNLYAENIKRLVAVEIHPDGNLVQITGRNGQGKTSVLDSIWWALAGASYVQDAPIREGAARATIKLDLGEFTVTRTFKRKTSDATKVTTSLIVETAEGARFPSPQTVLDDLLGELSFDPLAFARAPAKQQVNMLKALVPDFDFDAIDTKNAEDFEARRDLNRQAKELRAQAAGIAVPEGTPLEPINEAALVDELEAAHAHNTEIARQQHERESLESGIKTDLMQSQEWLEQAKKLRAAADELLNRVEGNKAKLADLADLPPPMDTTEVRQKIEAAKETNRYVAEVQRCTNLASKADTVEAEAAALTRAIEDRTKQKAKAIAAAKLPVEGLVFGSEEVTLAGVPFDQASDAEQLRASVAIAMALNPKLRIVRIRDGSLLDEDSLRMVAEMAEANDCQVWCERVDTSGKVGFVIEDGHVQGQELQQAS